MSVYSVAPRPVAIIAEDDLLRRRLSAMLVHSVTVQYATQEFSTFEDFCNSPFQQEAAALIVAGDPRAQHQFVAYRESHTALLPVIFIKAESTGGVPDADWSRVPLSEVFEIDQVRPDLIMIALKYILEVNLVVSEMHVLQQAMELADQTNNRFFQYMSHELAGPLQAARTLHENASVLEDVGELKSNARIAALAITHVLDAINNISEYVRVSKNQLCMRRETFSVIPVVADLIQLFGAHAAHKGISLEMERSGDSDFVYLGDKLRLRQVLVNLLKNAIKFTDQGAIRIGLRRVMNEMHISVSDTGVGMDPSLVAEILSRDSYTPGAGFDGGLGIGLKLSREFLALAGGHLKVESAPGQGSTFTAVLPNECYLQQPENIRIAG